MLLGHLLDGAVKGLLQKASEPGELELELIQSQMAQKPMVSPEKMPLQVQGLPYFPPWSGILARAPSQ